MKTRYVRFASRKVQSERRIYELKYDLTIDKLIYFSSTIEEYGVCVTAVCNGKSESHEVRCITTNPDRIMYALSLIICGAVFPDELDETLENILN